MYDLPAQHQNEHTEEIPSPVLAISFSMAGVVLVAAPIENALAGTVTERALSGDQGLSLHFHGNVPGHSNDQSIGET